MTCPFLKETQVKFCQMAGVRKLIPLDGVGPDGSPSAEICTTPEFRSCTVFSRQPAEAATASRCPWLQASLMQYCEAAPVTRMVPYSESMLSRCGNGAYRYCDVYLSLAHPEREEEDIDGVRVPSWLHYTHNHFWLDVAEDGTCHAGIDGFLARLLGPVERVTYVRVKGKQRPAVVLTANGVDLHLVFPNPLVITGCNLYLRSNPAHLVTEPYSSGWLFEGKVVPETMHGLMDGMAAREWMRREHGRMNEFIHEQLLAAEAGPLMADGGVFSPDLLLQLDREQALALFHSFFSPFAGGQSGTARNEGRQL